jgi:hypothetical protein
MQKIPTLYKRNPEDMKRVLDEVTPGCEWVLAGEGVPTRKWDGTCVMLDEEGNWWARREVKPGQELPKVFRLEETDPNTGKIVGWVPMEASAFAKWHAEALKATGRAPEHWQPGTYELIGPKINGNPEGRMHHWLVPHGAAIFKVNYDQWPMLRDAAPRDLIEACREMGWEGIVWHHPDGRMAKLKVRDYPT